MGLHLKQAYCSLSYPMSLDLGGSSFSLQLSMQIVGERRILQNSAHQLGIQIMEHLCLLVGCGDRLPVLNRKMVYLSLTRVLYK